MGGGSEIIELRPGRVQAPHWAAAPARAVIRPYRLRVPMLRGERGAGLLGPHTESGHPGRAVHLHDVLVRDAAVAQNGDALCYASEGLRGEKEVMITAAAVK